MWVGELDVHDEVLLREFWEVSQSGDAFERAYSTFWSWPVARAAFQDAQHAYEQHALAAIEEGTVVGACQVMMPLLDNKHTAVVEPVVHPGSRRRGIGSALLERAIELCAEADRHTLTGEVNEPLGRGSWPGSAFARKHHFSVASEELHRVLDLPLSSDFLDELAVGSAANHGDYELVHWGNRVPDDYLNDYCRLQAAFNDEAPTGALDVEPEHWDEERVRERESRAGRLGRGTSSAAAFGVDGTMVALTEAIKDRDAPGWGVQSGTLVMPAHRGHRLGMAIKVLNMRQFQQRFPEVTALHSWNADVNGPMIAINDRLGFRPVERLLEVQRKL